MINEMRKHTIAKILLTAAAVLVFAALLSGAASSKVYGAEETTIREVHQVKLEGKKYCFFVKNNVVLTDTEISTMQEDIEKEYKEALEKEIEEKVKKEIEEKVKKEFEETFRAQLEEKYADITDEDERNAKIEEELKTMLAEEVSKELSDELSDELREKLRRKVEEEILTRSGLYLKQANCKKSSHKAVDIDTWNKSKKDEKKIVLWNETLDVIIDAALTDGDDRVKDGKSYITYMNMYLGREASEAESPKPISDRISFAELLLVAVATENDAKDVEKICKEEKVPAKKEDTKKKQKEKSSKDVDTKEKEEMLPEMRTIPMADRSGEPLKATLEDGSPVTLEWIDPGSEPKEDKSFLDKIPGGPLTLGALLLGLALLAVFLLKRRKADDSE